jgi:putative endonuclease
LERRLIEHNSKTGHFTSTCAPWKHVHSELFDARVDALKREKEIKSKKSRKYLENLIQG